MIEFKNVCFSYGEKQVLNDFNLTVNDGERICLFGESGKGKTTVLRLIMGLEKPQSGTVDVNGKVSAVFQEDRLLPFKSVKDNISFVGGENNTDEILSALNLTEEKDEYPSALSGGMARRVSIARALSGKSDIYIFDEPFTGLDGKNIDSAAEIINKITNGKTVVCVLHEKANAAKLGCKIIEL
ncbi:MAG: ATP-binding cassette domain-containing protein [Clostridiales bacterium]|nr:ABC transporter ATP-binding protein [Clostridia bacterium]MCR4563685.1 ATP-binding cassette domain-containing protein [Clostridiales bacterium]